MKKCPYCAEEILDDAIKCKHCGEFFTQNPTYQKPIHNEVRPETTHKPETCIKYFRKCTRDLTDCPTCEFFKDQKILVVEGKYSCPKCSYKYTKCEKHIGCAVIIIIFISLGLGLIMLPFLPYDCECPQCGNKWRT